VMMPYDWVLVGLALDLVGGLVLAKCCITKGILHAYREAQPRFGVNSFAVKSALLQKGEAVVGGALLTVGFGSQLCGGFQSGGTGTALGRISSVTHLLGLLLVVVSLGIGATVVANTWGRRRFRRYFLRNYKADAPPLKQVGAELDALGWLVDKRRARGEDDTSYRKRLEQVRARLGAKYAGRDKSIQQAETTRRRPRDRRSGADVGR